MFFCEVDCSQLLCMVRGVSEGVHEGRLGEGRLLVPGRAFIVLGGHDAVSALALIGTYLALHILSAEPTAVSMPHDVPSTFAQIEAFWVATSRSIQVWKPRSRIPRGQSMGEAVHLPGLIAVPVCGQDTLQPRVACAHALSEEEKLLNAILTFVPEHVEYLLFSKRMPFLEWVSEDGSCPNRWQLPQVASEN